MKHLKRHYRTKLDPDWDLAGATPETLALALLGKKPQVCPGASNEPPDVRHANPEPVREPEPPQA